MGWLSQIFAPKQVSFLTAVRTSNVRALMRHLQDGVDPNKPTEEDPRPPIFFALHQGAEIVKLLIAHKASPNVTDEKGATPLHFAAKSGYVDTVKILIACGADVNRPDKMGHTPLFSALMAPSLRDDLDILAGLGPSPEAHGERAERDRVITLLKSHNAALSDVDVEMVKAMGWLPEANRQERHLKMASQTSLQYRRALQEALKEYEYLHDAYRIIRKKVEPSQIEKDFAENFNHYESLAQRA